MPETSANTPTAKQFKAFEAGYDYFNELLFDGKLPPVILNLSRKSKAMGFVAPFRWRKAEDEAGQGSIHELSINPEILSMSAIEVYSTLVHEMCHIWQYEYAKPSRNGYHNKQWANKMEAVGLIPSHTGQEDGNRTGQNMSDYPQENGVFLKALTKMPDKFKLPFTSVEGDRRANYQALMGLITGNGTTDEEEEAPKSGKRTKYSCPCGFNVWGKSGLKIICDECKNCYTPVEKGSPSSNNTFPILSFQSD